MKKKSKKLQNRARLCIVNELVLKNALRINPLSAVGFFVPVFWGVIMQWLSILSGKISGFLFGIKTWLLVAALVIAAGYLTFLKIDNLKLVSQLKQSQKNISSLVTDKAYLSNRNLQLTQNLQSANQSIISMQAQLKKEREIAATRTKELIKNKEYLQREINNLERAAERNETDFEKCLNVVVPHGY